MKGSFGVSLGTNPVLLRRGCGLGQIMGLWIAKPYMRMFGDQILLHFM
jgi:hypothetical protein